jgi:hypothetical protein
LINFCHRIPVFILEILNFFLEMFWIVWILFGN